MIQYNDNHIECLDLHLSKITLNSYRGTLPEIILARFFVVRARVLKVMRLNMHLYRKYEWFVDLHRRLRQNGKGYDKDEFHFGTSDDRVTKSHRVNPIQEFSMDDTFAKIMRF